MVAVKVNSLYVTTTTNLFTCSTRCKKWKNKIQPTAFNLVTIVFKLSLCVMVFSNLLTYSYKNEHGWSALRAI